MGHDAGFACRCVTEHYPGPAELHLHHVVPLYAGGGENPENEVWLCPTSHVNVHELIRAWERAGGEPSWEVRRRFGPYVRDLARRGWEERRGSPAPPPETLG